MQKLSLRAFGLSGSVIFLFLFSLTFVNPRLVESSAKGFVEWKLSEVTHARIDSIQVPKERRFEKLLGAKTKALRAKMEHKIDVLKRQLKSELPALLKAELSKVRDPSCECRKYWQARLKTSMTTELKSLEEAKAKLETFAQGKYMAIVEKLTRDVRIFLGANGLVFLLMLLASFLKPKAIKHLFLPGVLILISTVFCTYLYLFEQNWLYTILYESYTGFSYLGYLVFVFALLCDIVLNKGRVTTEIINACLQIVGQAASRVPC